MSIFEKHAREAADRGAELLITCECYLDGYCADMLPAKHRFTGIDRTRFGSMAQADDNMFLSRLKRYVCKGAASIESLLSDYSCAAGNR